MDEVHQGAFLSIGLSLYPKAMLKDKEDWRRRISKRPSGLKVVN